MWNALQNLTEKRQKNKKCIKTIQKKNEFCINRQLCEKNKSGKTNILGFFVGQVLKKSGGKANPSIVNKIVNEEINKR